MRFIFPVAALFISFSAAAFAGGSPKAFEKFAGNYDGEGVFKDELTTLKQSVTADIESEGSLTMVSSPRSAVLAMNGTVETTDGREFPMAWKLTFRRKNACLVEIVYPSGAIGQVNGRYDANKRRITFSGTNRYTSSGGLRFGTSTGSLRLTPSKIIYFQQDNFPGEIVTARKTLTKD